MNCKHVTKLISPLLDGELSEASSTQVRAHLDTCPACAAEATALQRATLLLQQDATSPQLPTHDLYAAFQERLVMQAAGTPVRSRQIRRTSPAWLLPRLAVCLVGAVCVVNILRHKFFPYNHTETALLTAAYNLSQSHNDEPMHITEIRRYRTPEGDERTRFFHTWWHKGYSYTRTMEQKPQHHSENNLTSSDFVLSYGYGTPGGTLLHWDAEGRTNKPVRLEWIPCDPTQRANYAIQYDADRYASWCRQIVKYGKTEQAQVQDGDTMSGPGQYSLHIDDMKSGLERSDGPDDSRTAPASLTLWFNTQGRLLHYQELQRESGKPLLQDTLIDYPQYPIPQIAAPDIPRNRPVALAYKPSRSNAPIPAERLVKPVWLTMTKKEKAEVEGAIWTFTVAWRTHNAGLLKSVVDLDTPLEITRPEKRAGLTREDVWQNVWLKRMQSWPDWRYLTFNTDFAFEAAPRLLDEVPLNVGEWNLDHSLPGLNVLAWMNGGLADGHEYKTGARFYLVKHPTGWKLSQFGLLHNGVSSAP